MKITITCKARPPKTSATCPECDITGMHLMRCSRWVPNAKR
jgi:hypothetical protein